MHLENDKYIVNIAVDTTYTVDSADNKPYDLVFNPDNMKHNDYSKTFCIEVVMQEQTKIMALIGGLYCYDSDCAILEGDILTVLQNNMITQIDFSSNRLVLHKVLDTFGCNFGIYRKSNYYIIYGEIEITRLNEQFEKVWAFSGGDIFVSQNERCPFELEDDKIKLNDWNGNYYEIDLNGNLILMR
ncbi:hypothetical protein LAD12857_13800 [Lacrimispora amygdalina]|uniref:Uncharacterized protein n=1 Tax=Lacrimispora amygdalina TaxID=253257 RepID=A0A3E2NB07_9FIRM|nr:hypothetical protein [Clostridium indicum]RFZ78090.1 hypothetical protein DS742_15215 [Clostridium indicum]